MNCLKINNFLKRNNSIKIIPKIKFNDFEATILPILSSGICLPKNKLLKKAYETLIQSTEAVNSLNGFEELLTTQGDVLTDEESENLKDFLLENNNVENFSLLSYIEDLIVDPKLARIFFNEKRESKIMSLCGFHFKDNFI